MKILLYLVESPQNMKIKARAFGISQPLGPGYIASALLEDGHQVSIIDNSIEGLDEAALTRRLRELAPDIVGITAYTFAIGNCFSAAVLIKKVLPNATIIFGGPHPTYLPQETIVHPCVDIVVMGEGEITMREIPNALAGDGDLGKVQGIVFKDQKGAVINTGPREFIKDLDTISFPAYALMHMDKYYPSVNRRFSKKRFGSIITSRGCPHSCTFCSHRMFGKKIRFRSPENVAEELRLLKNRYGIGELIFLDDTFTADISRAITICELIKKEKIDIIWTCNTRADHASKELYLALRSAGCRGVHIGVESASQEMLDSMKKGITIAQIENAVRLAKTHIGDVVCGFIIGMPGDTVERVNKTIAFARRLDPDYATFNIATPVPGSELFEWAAQKGMIRKTSQEWEACLELFSPKKPVAIFSELSSDDLIRLTKKAFRDFYFRPGYLWKRLMKINPGCGLFEYARGICAVLRYQLTGFKN